MSDIDGYSYIRFSAKGKQARGDSVRRQTDGRADAYCERKGWTLSPKTYADLGVSAFRGKNALVGNLGEFLKAVKSGAVKPGSALIVESLDRISRQGIDEGYDLIKRILKAGILIVTLTPEREFDASATKSLSKGALEIQLILERAAEESERKSERCSAASSAKKARARTGDKAAVVAGSLPAWCRLEGKKIVVDPVKAAAVKQIFQLAAAGYGAWAIVKKLTADGVTPIGVKPAWIKGYVVKLLSDRRVVGEYQPTKAGQPDGDPILGYLPAVVTEAEWYVARAGAEERRRKPGRAASDSLNLFQGLLRDARDGSNMILMARATRSGELSRVLGSAKADNGHGKVVTFPQAVLERAVLSRLAEVDPADIIGESGSADEVAALIGERAEVRARIAEIEAELANGSGGVTALARVLGTLETRDRDLGVRIEKARADAARPLSGAWADAKSLLATLDAAPDKEDASLRLRSALRQIINSMYLLVVPRRLDRLAAVTIRFKEGATETRYRTFTIIHRPAHSAFGKRTAAATWVGSVAHPTDRLPFNKEDLRNADDVAGVESYLQALPQDVINLLLRDGQRLP